jgi:hypothetical protein
MSRLEPFRLRRSVGSILAATANPELKDPTPSITYMDLTRCLDADRPASGFIPATQPISS